MTVVIREVMLPILYFFLGCACGRLIDFYRFRLPAQAMEAACVTRTASGSDRLRQMLTATGTGVLFALAGIFCVPGMGLIFCWFFLSCLLLQSLIDYDCQLLLDKVSLTMMLAGFFYAWYFQKNLTDMLTGLAAGTGIMLLLYIASRGGMGLGDVKLTAVLGLWLGTEKVFLCLLTGFLAGGVAGMLLLLTGARQRRDAIAFGPFLCLGAAIALLWGDRLLSFYWRLFTIN